MEILNSIKNILSLFVPKIILVALRIQKQKKLLKKWKRDNCPVPPPHIVKQMVIEEYQQKYGYTTFVETGTFLGHMVEAQKKHFNKIISIELGVDLFEKAKKRFRRDKNITIVQGDSGKVLPEVLKDIKEPVIFWLDGHYSAGITVKGDKDCPIFEELEAIFNNSKFNNILLIDDARSFTGVGDYPTIEGLTEFIKSKNAKYQVEVKHDIIRCVI